MTDIEMEKIKAMPEYKACKTWNERNEVLLIEFMRPWIELQKLQAEAQKEAK